MQEQGFTLMELIAVIVIVALMFGLLVPNLDRMSPKYSIRAVARRIASTIEEVRSQAALESKTFSIVYNLDNQEYWILLPQLLDETGNPIDEEREILGGKAEKPLKGVKITSVILPNNEEIQYGQVTIDVTPYGNTGSHIIYLENEDEELLSVKFNALLGTVTFYYREISFTDYEEEQDEESLQTE
ncbi:MAG: prepilin-type N-terminal cleavage/methylation domain-containing protein [Planctomycetota bacterium]